MLSNSSNPYPLTGYFLENALSAQTVLTTNPQDPNRKWLEIKNFVNSLLFFICNFGTSVNTAVENLSKRNIAELAKDRKQTATILYLFCKAKGKDIPKLKELPLKEQIDLVFDFEKADPLPEISKIVESSENWSEVLKDFTENDQKQVIVAAALYKALVKSQNPADKKYDELKKQLNLILLEGPQYLISDSELDHVTRPFHAGYRIPYKVEKTLNELLSESRYNGKNLKDLKFYDISGWDGTKASLVTKAAAMPEPVMKTEAFGEPALIIRVDGQARNVYGQEQESHQVILLGPDRDRPYEWHQTNITISDCQFRDLNKIKKLLKGLLIVKDDQNNEWMLTVLPKVK